VTVQRGWWDMSVDPSRYRLQVPDPVVRALGALTPRADLALILNAPTDVLLARKAELGRRELDRQTSAWHRALPPSIPRVHLDASAPADEVLAEAREAVVNFMESRTIGRLAHGWSTLPPVGRIRWWIPRGPARVTESAMAIHNPMHEQGRRAWKAAIRFAALGGFRLLPRGTAPPVQIRRRLAPHLPPRTTFALAPANHPGRYTALLVDDGGRRRGLAKLATSDAGADAVAHEANAIRTMGPGLVEPLRPPRILAEERGLLLLEAVEKEIIARPWVLEEEVAASVGHLFGMRATNGEPGIRGFTHGDLAPWNLLRTNDGIVLVDWESATTNGTAFHDVCHWIAQTHSLLGRPSLHEVVDGVELGRGWIGEAIRAYAATSGCSPDDAAGALRSYLRERAARPWPSNARDRNARQALERLLAELEG
jgi:hypothetical protein